jgi:hypothetical protein
MKDSYHTDELTTKMHGELQVTEDMDKVHRIITVRNVIDMGLMTKAQALDAYGISDEDLHR